MRTHARLRWSAPRGLTLVELPVVSERKRFAFTLVELLVVIAIIGILVALLLPAVQAAREAARRTQCMNHVKQLATACMNHENTHKHFPSGGWGYDWVGDADMGSGEEQPGSWMFNILPYLEEQVLHDLPKDGQHDVITPVQEDGAQKMVFPPAPVVFHCPSRRPAVAYIIESHHVQVARNAGKLSSPTGYSVGSNDYAANAGDTADVENQNGLGGPTTFLQGLRKDDAVRQTWALVSNTVGKKWDGTYITGVMFQLSEIKLRHITDGASKTYLLGERYVRANNYMRSQPAVNGNGSQVDGGDSWGWAWGFNKDTIRSAKNLPLADYPDLAIGDIFGSAHPGAFHMAFCDGHVEAVSYDIDLLVHQNYGNRRDQGETTIRK